MIEFLQVNTYAVLLLLGSVLVLSGLGKLKVLDKMEFSPSEDIPVIARSILVMTGLVLILAGITLVLYQQQIWQKGLALVYLITCVLLIFVFGVFILKKGAIVDRKLFQSWGADKHSFNFVVITKALNRYKKKYHLLAVCYKKNTCVDCFKDTDIAKSSYFRITKELTQEIKVNFPSEFSEGIKTDTLIHCALCVVPLKVQRDDVHTLSDVDHHKGEILATIGCSVP